MKSNHAAKKLTIKKASQKTVALILENIRSAENVGALFRTADAAGISHIYLVGYTPAPLDRFKRPNTKIATRALGAEKNILWSIHTNTLTLITKLKKDNWQIVALEQAPTAIDYKKVAKQLGQKVAYIVGNEVDGVLPKTLARADIIAEIPMRGKKESLNVSVATGIALFRMLDI